MQVATLLLGNLRASPYLLLHPDITERKGDLDPAGNDVVPRVLPIISMCFDARRVSVDSLSVPWRRLLLKQKSKILQKVALRNARRSGGRRKTTSKKKADDLWQRMRCKRRLKRPVP